MTREGPRGLPASRQPCPLHLFALRRDQLFQSATHTSPLLCVRPRSDSHSHQSKAPTPSKHIRSAGHFPGCLSAYLFVHFPHEMSCKLLGDQDCVLVTGFQWIDASGASTIQNICQVTVQKTLPKRHVLLVNCLCRIMNGHLLYGTRYPCVRWPSFLAKNRNSWFDRGFLPSSQIEEIVQEMYLRFWLLEYINSLRATWHRKWSITTHPGNPGPSIAAHRIAEQLAPEVTFGRGCFVSF